MNARSTLERIILTIGIAGTAYRFYKAFGDAFETGSELHSAQAFFADSEAEIKTWTELSRLSSNGRIDEMKQVLQNSLAKGVLLQAIELYETGKIPKSALQNVTNHYYVNCLLAYGQQQLQWQSIIKKYEEKSLPNAIAQSFIHSLLYSSKRFTG